MTTDNNHEKLVDVGNLTNLSNNAYINPIDRDSITRVLSELSSLTAELTQLRADKDKEMRRLKLAEAILDADFAYDDVIKAEPTCPTMQSAIRVIKELTQLRKDKERLDEIQKNNWTVDNCRKGGKWACYRPATNYEYELFHSLRPAIDAAISTQNQTNK